MVGTFKVGEKVVYPAHGVGVIEGVQTKVISGSERKFYMLRIIDSDMTIMIPTENVQSVGLRRIIGKDMVAKVYRILRDKKVEIDQQTWNRRYREYTEKIKTGSVLEIAKVLRDLFVLKGDKDGGGSWSLPRRKPCGSGGTWAKRGRFSPGTPASRRGGWRRGGMSGAGPSRGAPWSGRRTRKPRKPRARRKRSAASTRSSR